MAFLVIATEFFGGIALIAGFLTRVAAVGIAIDMVIAVLWCISSLAKSGGACQYAGSSGPTGDDGKGMLNYANLVGLAIDGEMSNLYVPGDQTNLPASAARYTVSMVSAPIGNFITEFFPDVARHIHVQVVILQRISTRWQRPKAVCPSGSRTIRPTAESKAETSFAASLTCHKVCGTGRSRFAPRFRRRVYQEHLWPPNCCKSVTGPMKDSHFNDPGEDNR
jgi:hypothetical protein